MIVTLTVNPTVDKSCTVEHVEPDRKLRCSPPGHEPGGGGLNVSRAIQKLGGASRAIWASGGITGELLDRLLSDEQIDHRPVPIERMTRQNLIVFEQSSDRQFRFGMPGAELSEDEIDRVLDAVRENNGDYLVASGSLPPGVGDDFFRRVAQVAADNDSRFIVDTSGDPLKQALEVGAWLIKPNVRELCQLVGCELDSDDQIRDAAQRVVHEGKAEHVVVSLGAGGALLATRDDVQRINSPTVPIRSRVGAGDSMVAGIVLHHSRDHDVLDATRFGIAAGAAAVMTPGTALCCREDTERLFEQMNGVQTS
jgi:6-phosphofructokinase 2